MSPGQGAGSRRYHTNKHGRPGPADGLRGRRRRRLAHGPVEFTAGDGLLHSWECQPRSHRLPERREAHERHGAEIQGPEHKAAGRGLRHEHDLERLLPVSGHATTAWRGDESRRWRMGRRGSHRHAIEEALERERDAGAATRAQMPGEPPSRRPTTSSRRACWKSLWSLAS